MFTFENTLFPEYLIHLYLEVLDLIINCFNYFIISNIQLTSLIIKELSHAVFQKRKGFFFRIENYLSPLLKTIYSIFPLIFSELFKFSMSMVSFKKKKKKRGQAVGYDVINTLQQSLHQSK